MIEMKTSELIGPALDWMVAKGVGVVPEDQQLEYITPNHARPGDVIKIDKITIAEPGKLEYQFSPSTDWSQGGPLIDKMGGFELKVWLESKPETKCEAHIHNYDGNWIVFGPTPLVAAMRCIVAAKLGDTVQVPKELR